MRKWWQRWRARRLEAALNRIAVRLSTASDAADNYRTLARITQEPREAAYWADRAETTQQQESALRQRFWGYQNRLDGLEGQIAGR
jgi:hypothetical protein